MLNGLAPTHSTNCSMLSHNCNKILESDWLLGRPIFDQLERAAKFPITSSRAAHASSLYLVPYSD